MTYEPIPSQIPTSPTGVLVTIGSYLYQEYTDDEDLQGFIAAQNTLQNNYVDTFNGLNLPIYTQPLISGPLLDWVANGIYGYSRPSASSDLEYYEGPYNTYTFNYSPFTYNGFRRSTLVNAAFSDDDFYKRCLTWHFYKGDGKYFSVRWLKRRIMRFLYGANGADTGIDETYRVSVIFGYDYSATIRIVMSLATLVESSVYNTFLFNAPQPFNYDKYEVVTYPPVPYVPQFLAAVNSGILELPFQYSWSAISS